MAISLTAGMRANLVNLQNTSKMMEQTQVRLNTGKKVNSALDDPMSYFTAASHMSRADDLGTLKNGMSEAIQTITAANDGITSMIALIEEAKSKAVSAKSADEGTDGSTVSFDISDVSANDVITIGGTGYMACNNAGADQFGINEGTGGAEITAMNLMQMINSETDAAIAGGDIKASVSGTTITIYSAGSSDIASGDITTSLDTTVNAASGDEVAALAEQYETLISQLDELRDDAAYKGVNLMDVSHTLTVDFEGDSKLDVEGFDGSILNGLKISQTAVTDATHGVEWGDDTAIDTDIEKLDAAMKYLERQASSLASSLSIVSTRQDFTQNMINNLTTGADNLTLADMNEEGANMLMLQTQQSLGSTSLSLAAQAAQSVLRLF